MLIISYYTTFIKISILILSLLFLYILELFFLNNYYFKENNFIIIEFYFLFLFAIFICFLAISSYNLILLYIFLECLSYILYTISCSIGIFIYNIEAVIKYFCVGSISSIVYILGCVLIYGFGNGSLHFDSIIIFHSTIKIISNCYLLGVILLICSFFIKLGTFPFHF